MASHSILVSLSLIEPLEDFDESALTTSFVNLATKPLDYQFDAKPHAPEKLMFALSRLLLIILALKGCGPDHAPYPLVAPEPRPWYFADVVGSGQLLTALTYEEPNTEIVEYFDIDDEVQIDVAVIDQVVYAPVAFARESRVCILQLGCLESFSVPLGLEVLLTSPLKGAFFIGSYETVFENGSGYPPRIGFVVRHPDCYGRLCPMEDSGPYVHRSPWWSEATVFEYCSVSGGPQTTHELLEPVPDQENSLRLVLRGPFGLRPARQPDAACIRHERPMDHVSVDTILTFVAHEPSPNLDYTP